MQIKLIAVGEKMPRWVADGFTEFTRRLPPHLAPRLIEIPPGRGRRRGDASRARAEEAERLLTAAGAARLIALDEAGRGWRTTDLARRLEGWLMDGRDTAFLVGGPDGLDAGLRARAELCWSLSPLTFPHMLVRVIVAEQLYRAWTVLEGHPYHREG